MVNIIYNKCEMNFYIVDILGNHYYIFTSLNLTVYMFWGCFVIVCVIWSLSVLCVMGFACTSLHKANPGICGVPNSPQLFTILFPSLSAITLQSLNNILQPTLPRPPSLGCLPSLCLIYFSFCLPLHVSILLDKPFNLSEVCQKLWLSTLHTLLF